MLYGGCCAGTHGGCCAGTLRRRGSFWRRSLLCWGAGLLTFCCLQPMLQICGNTHYGGLACPVPGTGGRAQADQEFFVLYWQGSGWQRLNQWMLIAFSHKSVLSWKTWSSMPCSLPIFIYENGFSRFVIARLCILGDMLISTDSHRYCMELDWKWLFNQNYEQWHIIWTI